MHFTAHSDPRESDLTQVDMELVEGILKRPGTAEFRAAALVTMGGSDEGTNHPLWPYLLVSLFGLLASEAWLVLRQ